MVRARVWFLSSLSISTSAACDGEGVAEFVRCSFSGRVCHHVVPYPSVRVVGMIEDEVTCHGLYMDGGRGVVVWG